MKIFFFACILLFVAPAAFAQNPLLPDGRVSTLPPMKAEDYRLHPINGRRNMAEQRYHSPAEQDAEQKRREAGQKWQGAKENGDCAYNGDGAGASGTSFCRRSGPFPFW